MPPKKSSLGRKTKSASANFLRRSRETAEQREARLLDMRSREAAVRQSESAEERDARLQDMRSRAAAVRLALIRKAKAVRKAAETQELRERLAKEATQRANEMPFERERRLAKRRRHPETAKANERRLSKQSLAEQSTAAMRAIDIPVAKKKRRLAKKKPEPIRIIINNKIFLHCIE